MLYFRLKRTLRLGVQSIWRHRLRSVLTMLGIVFGVLAVVTMLAIGEGASRKAQDEIRRLGSQNILLRSIKPPQDEDVDSETSRLIEYGLTYADSERIATTVPGVEVVVPVRTLRKDASFLARRRDVELKGTVPWYLSVGKMHLQTGRFLNTIDMHNRLPVCVIGPGVARELFRNYDPIGESLKVQGEYYRVVGVMAERGAATGKDAASDISFDVYIPLTVSQDRYGDIDMRRSAGTSELKRVELHEINVRVDSIEMVEQTAVSITHLLERFHKKHDYEVIVPLERLRLAEETKRIFNIVLGGIAAMSLLVGGIGIMNIMLASVTERTREIGIRRALGAKRRDIIIQFLAETVILSSSGGILGLALGIATPVVVTHFADMPTIITLWSVVLSFSISVFIGIVFGLYPAWRAAQMDPIEALRHE